MKSISMFVCQECGYETSQWLGKCPECNTWNSLKEFQVRSKIKDQKSKIPGRITTNELKPKNLSEITFNIKERVLTGFSEMDGVMGGGIVKGSVTLLAGDPGIGKSTLLLQVALNIAFFSVVSRSVPLSSALKRGTKQNNTQNNADTQFSNTVLYISGEESEEQVKLRAERISPKGNHANFLLLSSNNTDAICEVIEETCLPAGRAKPSLVIIDSIQTMESENLEGLAGSVGQVRYSTFSFIRLAKSLNIPIILVGHVTKEGMVAGPMVLSHMVDVVLFLEGEKSTGTRILRSFKNRFGPVDEVGIFAMEGLGMKEVKNPEEMFLNDAKTNVPGSILVATMEGTRAFLVEIQALVVFSKLPMPRRVASGIDYKRLELLIAVLQKHCRLPLETNDVFVNVAGGLKLKDPAIDLGVCLAILSSFKNINLSRTVAISEIGLLGELRSVPFLDKRIKEAKKLGFKNIITRENFKNLNEVIKSL